MDKETGDAISETGMWITIIICAFFVTTCAVSVNELNSTEEICYKLLEAKQDGKGVCDKRPSHWSQRNSREVEDTVLLPE